MIALIALMMTFAGAILAEVAMVIYKKINRKPGRALGYSMVGLMLCLSVGLFFGFVIDGFIFIVHGFQTSNTQEIACAILGLVVGFLFFIGTLGLWFANTDEQTIVAAKDPFGPFFPYHPGSIVGTVPWLIRKPNWEAKTTAEVISDVVVNLETKFGTVLPNATIQVVYRIDKEDPMNYFDLDDNPDQREKSAKVAIDLETRRIANNKSILYTDDELLANAQPIKTAIIQHMKDENGCGGMMRGMSLVFDRVTMSDFDRDVESAEAARSVAIAKRSNQVIKEFRRDLDISDELAVNRAMSIMGQDSQIKILALEGLDKLDPESARAFGLGFGAATRVGGRGGRGGNSQGNRNRGNRRGGRGRGGRGGNNQPS